MPSPPLIHRHVRSPGLVNIALWCCALGLVLLTLRPWSGWRAPGHSLLRFLTEPWNRYWSWFDVWSNLVAYMPLGALLAIRLRRSLRGMSILLIAALAGGVLSFALETLQNFLPTRVPSSLDLVLNLLGATVGATAALLVMQRPNDGRELKWHRPAIATREALPVVLLALTWLLTQFAPQRMLFETGSLVSPGLQMLAGFTNATAAGQGPSVEFAASLSGWLAPWQASANYSTLIESISVSIGFCVIGLLVLDVVTLQRWRVLTIALAVAAGILAHAVARTGVIAISDTGLWLSAGTQAGLLIGPILLGLLSSLNRRSRLLAMLILLTAGIILTNVMPDNAYRAVVMKVAQPEWLQGLQSGLRLLSILWPFVALAVIARQLYLHLQRWDGMPFMEDPVGMRLRPIPSAMRHAQ